MLRLTLSWFNLGMNKDSFIRSAIGSFKRQTYCILNNRCLGPVLLDASSILTLIPESVNNQPECRTDITPPGITQAVSFKRRTPIGQHPPKGSILYLFRHFGFGNKGNAVPGLGRFNTHITLTENKGAGYMFDYLFALFFKLPVIDGCMSMKPQY